MKKCSYCGKSYPDDLVMCPQDQTSLVSDSGPLTQSQNKQITKGRLHVAGGLACVFAGILVCLIHLSWEHTPQGYGNSKTELAKMLNLPSVPPPQRKGSDPKFLIAGAMLGFAGIKLIFQGNCLIHSAKAPESNQ